MLAASDKSRSSMGFLIAGAALGAGIASLYYRRLFMREGVRRSRDPHVEARPSSYHVVTKSSGCSSTPLNGDRGQLCLLVAGPSLAGARSLYAVVLLFVAMLFRLRTRLALFSFDG
jgi:hypothetical protein